MSAKRGTYLVEFYDGVQIVCGNNYKPWNTHAVEYAWNKYQDGRPRKDLLKSVRFSDTPFVDDGGLKWASPHEYNKIIISESLKRGLKAPLFDKIEFSFSNADKKKLDKDLKYWGLI